MLTAALGTERCGRQQTLFGRVTLVGSKMVHGVDVGKATVQRGAAVCSGVQPMVDSLAPMD